MLKFGANLKPVLQVIQKKAFKINDLARPWPKSLILKDFFCWPGQLFRFKLSVAPHKSLTEVAGLFYAWKFPI